MMKNIVFASNNQHKTHEVSSSLSDLSNITVVAQSEYNVPEVAETGLTFVENALIKARNACSHSGLPSIADDSGLIVPCLQGGPGLYSARYAGPGASDLDNINKLLLKPGLQADSRRLAYFYCCIVYLTTATDPCPQIFIAKWHGELLREPAVATGFGYDPIFWVAEHSCSAAELPTEVKNQISHRGLALEQLKEFFAVNYA